MTTSRHQSNPITSWYENARYPGLILAGVILLLYGRSLTWGFALDDLRQARLLEDYHEGRRDSLDLYRFLVSDQDNQLERRLGWYAWWVGDDVRYRHWRPASEYLLYGQYAVFGNRPAGFHAVSIALYLVGAWLALALFRFVSDDERLARWAALVFALMAGHAIPVVFISAQSDVLALALGVGAMLAAARFVKTGAPWGLAIAAALYVVALGSKEACLPLAVLPIGFAWLFRERSGAGRRGWGATVLLMAIGLVWLALYVRGGYGANNSVMLDPLHDPAGYFRAMPQRALALLSSLVIPLNPFLFLLRPRGAPWLLGYCALGAAAMAAMAWGIRRGSRGRRGLGLMALWIIPFVPILVCTVPDDRVMLLPGVGFAFLAGAWITGRNHGGEGRLNKAPLIWFVAVHAAFAFGSSQFFRFIAQDQREFLGAAAQGFGRGLSPGDCAFFLNDRRDPHVLFVQLCFEEVTGMRDVSAAFLSDAEDPIVSRVDSHSLRIRSEDAGLFTGFVGAMGTSRDRPKQEGDELEAGEFTGRISEVTNEKVREVEIRFNKPLESDSYRFYWCDPDGRPIRWKPPPVEEDVAGTSPAGAARGVPG